MSAADSKSNAKQKQTFESALKRLEELVKEMEAGSLGLEDMIARFEEGRKLLAFCSGKLNEVDKKIEVIMKKGDKLVTEDYESGSKPVDEASDDSSPEEELF